MAVANVFHQFWLDLARGVHNLSTASFKVLLTNTAPVQASSQVRADITEISAGGGYPAGGLTAAFTSLTMTGGVVKLVLADATFDPSGAVGPFRYAVLYNDTPVSPADPLIAFWDRGSSVTLTAEDTAFTLDFDPTSGVLTIQGA